MISLSEAKKGRGIDDVIAGMTPPLPEQFKSPFPTSQRYEKLFADYKFICKDYVRIRNKSRFVRDPNYRFLGKKRLTDVLSPEEINWFLQSTIQYEHREDFHYELVGTGWCVDKLVQNSYRKGFNDFTLIVPNPRLTLLDHIEGTQDNPLRVRISGDVAGCGSNLKYVDLEIYGNTEFGCGSFADNSNLILHGDAPEGVGFIPRNSNFTILGRAMKESGHGAHNCTFKTNNQYTLQTLLRKAPRHKGYFEQGNRIIFIDEQGAEKIVRDFKD